MRRGPAYAATPLVIAVPHAGRFYPDGIDRARAVSQRVIQSLEDRYADLLIGAAVARGAVAIVAPVARAWIDLNRAPDPDDGGRHARAGLGLVPTRLGGQRLWQTDLGADALRQRVDAVHKPYHAAIAAALSDAQTRHGYALLIDCHSMPPIRSGPGVGARLVIGDRHGVSADRSVSEAIVAEAQRRGFAVARNAPYAGAYTIAAHGRPQARIDAVQIEVDRSLYLDAATREPSGAIAEIVQLFAALCDAALIAADRGPLLHAAE